MRCYKQPPFLRNKPDKIADIWEVRLNPVLWSRIRAVTRERKISFSMVSRYCIFLLTGRAALRDRAAFRDLRQQDVEEQKLHSEHHRHLVCFYGEDIKVIRVTALELGVSVSCLIRIALRLFLRHFDMESHSHRRPSDEALFWLAIKRTYRYIHSAESNQMLHYARHYLVQCFHPHMRWSLQCH